MPILLRKRSRSNGGLSALNSEDEIDEDTVTTPLIPRSSAASFVRPVAPPQAPPTFYPKCCMVFSLAGMIFLSSFAYLLSIDSPYMQVSAENEGKKPELADCMMRAVFMYAACFSASAWVLWRRSRIVAQPIADSRLVD